MSDGGGKSYEGELKYDALDGRGILFYSNGDKYTGEIKSSTKYGYGVLCGKDGQILRIGEWVKGEYQQ
jgi:hypothetical protein